MKKVSDDANDTITLEFLDTETKRDFMEVESVSTVTLFAGQPPVDHIRERVMEIISKNPWLKGKLVRQKGKVVLQYSASSDPSAHFACVDSVKMDNHQDLKTSVVSMSESLKPYMVKKGKDSVNKKDDLQFRVTVGAINPEQYFLCVSLSHILGDGHTFYQIYGMLSGEVKTLKGERDMVRGNVISSESKEVNDIFSSVPIILNMVGKMMFGKKMNCAIKLINTSRVQEIKSEYSAKKAAESTTSSASFLSTNDIITSAYLKASNCDLGLMAINYRNRKEGLTNELAGNYESVIPYQKGDYDEPEFIRESLKSFKRRNAVMPLLPGFFHKKRSVLTMVTNWSGFYSQVEFPNSSHVAHFPVFTTYKDNFVLNICIIFMVAENQPAILSCEHPVHPVAETPAMNDLLRSET